MVPVCDRTLLHPMQLSIQARLRLKDLVLARYRDWAGVHTALKPRGLTISQSSLDRFFSGHSKSEKTFRTLSIALGTTPEALAHQIRFSQSFEAITSGNGAAQKLLRDPEAFRVAFQLWVEMTTRKLGVPIDPAQDVIAEIYDSWYAFFKSGRELTKTIPLHKNPRSPELRRLVQLSHAVLNDGLRPHLQRWQAKFRKWINSGGDRAQSAGLSPQEAQQLFPEWKALRDDLLATNQRLISYVASLETMVGRPNAPFTRSSRQRKKKMLPKGASI